MSKEGLKGRKEGRLWVVLLSPHFCAIILHTCDRLMQNKKLRKEGYVSLLLSVSLNTPAFFLPQSKFWFKWNAMSPRDTNTPSCPPVDSTMNLPFPWVMLATYPGPTGLLPSRAIVRLNAGGSVGNSRQMHCAGSLCSPTRSVALLDHHQDTSPEVKSWRISRQQHQSLKAHGAALAVTTHPWPPATSETSSPPLQFLAPYLTGSWIISLH